MNVAQSSIKAWPFLIFVLISMSPYLIVIPARLAMSSCFLLFSILIAIHWNPHHLTMCKKYLDGPQFPMNQQQPRSGSIVCCCWLTPALMSLEILLQRPALLSPDIPRAQRRCIHRISQELPLVWVRSRY